MHVKVVMFGGTYLTLTIDGDSLSVINIDGNSKCHRFI